MTEETRSSILARYRERIAQGARTKLTQTEQAALVDTFINDLAQLDQAQAIEARCNEELALLEQGYPTQTVASRLLAPYRKAIREAIDQGTLPLTDATSHIVRFTRRTGEQAQAQEHWALTHLKYDPATYARLRGQTIEHNNARQDDLQPVQVDSYLASVTELLTENEPHTLTAAIAAATGRRHTEVVIRGTFEATDHPYVLRFTGQQKKRDGQIGATAPFDIVTLVPAHLILEALERLRHHPDVQALQAITSVSDPAIRAYNSQVNRLVKARFEDSGIMPRLAGTRSVSIHRLRGVYAAVAVYLWCPEDQHEHRFIQHYLGHVLRESNLPNSTATTHYFHYRLLDGDGQPLHAKGVLRATLGAPPQGSTTDAPAQPSTSTTRRPMLALSDLERLTNLTDQLGFEGSASHRLHALLDWVEVQRAAPAGQPAELPPAIPEPVQDHPPSPIVPITPPAPEMLPVLADQAKTLAWLTDEINSLRQQLTSRQQAEIEARELRAERSIVQAKIDSLTQENGILRKRLDRFDSLRQALLGSGEGTPAQDAPEAPQAQPAAPGHTEEHAQPEAISPAPTPVQPQAAQSPATTAASTSKGQERAARIWQAVQVWNNAPERPTNEKVALSASTLEKRFGMFRPTAKAFLEAHQQEIDAHNQAHNITGPAHNRGVPDEVWEKLKQQAR